MASQIPVAPVDRMLLTSCAIQIPVGPSDVPRARNVATGTATWTDATETLATLTTKYYELPSVSRARATWLINEATAAVLTAITE